MTKAGLMADLTVLRKVLTMVGVMGSWSVCSGVVSTAERKAYEWVESMVGQRVHSMVGWKAGQQVRSKAAWKAGKTAAKKDKKMGESKDQR